MPCLVARLPESPSPIPKTLKESAANLLAGTHTHGVNATVSALGLLMENTESAKTRCDTPTLGPSVH